MQVRNYGFISPYVGHRPRKGRSGNYRLIRWRIQRNTGILINAEIEPIRPPRIEELRGIVPHFNPPPIGLGFLEAGFIIFDPTLFSSQWLLRS